MAEGAEERHRGEMENDQSGLAVLDYPALTEDLEQAKADIDEYGIALVANALSPEQVAVIDQPDQAYGIPWAST